MKRTEKLNVLFRQRRVGILSLGADDRLCTFAYDKDWLADGFSLSPLELPLTSQVFTAKYLPFNGNFGIFEDSLPDGYGRYLTRKVLRQQGIDDTTLSALDRLALVGHCGMGGLSYEPANAMAETETLTDLDALQAKALEVLGEQQDRDAGVLLYNSGNSGGARPKAQVSDNRGHWLVKFRHTYDPTDIGVSEYQYNEIARLSGIEVPDHKLMNGRYFASRRFDIDENGKRLHTATAGGLLGISLREPILDYSNLLALTGYLTQDADAVAEMFRRMVFNYLTDNKDDHAKNFSFIVAQTSGGWTWRLAPAYDLTLCAEGYNGQHATSVNGTGNPTASDFVAVGTKNRMTERECTDIIDRLMQTTSPIRRWSPK